MKRGEVAVENSPYTLRDLKSGKFKTRRAMATFGSPSHCAKQVKPPLAPAAYQPQLLASPHTPSRPPSFPELQSFTAIQPRAPYHQHEVNTAPVNPGAAYHPRYLHVHPPLPPPVEQVSGLEQHLRATQPPVSLPVQLQASANVSVSRTRPKRGICLRFARGTCPYGSSCKFLHEEAAICPFPQSAPVPVVAEQHTSASSDHLTSKQLAIPSSLHGSNFPSLSADAGVIENGSNHGSTRCEQSDSSTSPKLVFRDAVLQHTRKMTDVKPRQTPTLTTSGDFEHGKFLESSDGMICSSSQTLKGVSYQADHARIHSERTHQDQSGDLVWRAEDPVQATVNKQPRRDRQIHTSSHHSDQFYHYQHSHPVLPQSGQSGYSLQHVPLVSRGGRCMKSDEAHNSRCILDREASEIVRQIDLRLQELVQLQQLALAKLQEVVTSIWSDAAIGIYGSSFTRLALPYSDIDCVLSAPSVMDDQPAELLRRLEFELRRQPWTRRIELLGRAKIPVLKIVFAQSPTTEVMLDLTCAHSPGHSGLSAREIIYSYQVEMPALRPLVLIMKSHIQRRGLNSAYTGGLSSYGLVLLVIRFLQACGEKHHLTQAHNDGHKEGSLGNIHASKVHPRQHQISAPPLVYEFVREGMLGWRVGLGQLLLMCLETYVTFDYRRFGITVEGRGQYFPLSSDKTLLDPGSVISPYIVDPVEPTRSIGNSFRMHEVVQAWYELYQQLANGVPLEDALSISARTTVSA